MVTSGASFESDNEFALLPDINVTPFIDVMLVLLIIFMVTAPLLNAAIKVELPQAKAAHSLENQKPVIVTIFPDGNIQVGDLGTDLDGLVALVRSELGGSDRHIQVRGDAKADYGRIVTVLDQLASNGLTKIALVTHKRREALPRVE